jgi:hypothetical protein
MIKLLLSWALLTGILFVFYYFIDRTQKQETVKWARRLLWCSAVPAVGICVAIFLERL